MTAPISQDRSGARVTRAYWLLVLPLLIVLATFFGIPLLRIGWVSIADPSLGVGNYVTLLTDSHLQNIFWTTIRLCVITTVVSIPVAYFIAYMLVHSHPLHRVLMLFCILIPFWVSALLRGFSWIVILNGNGILNNTLRELGIISQRIGFLGEDLGVLIGFVHFMVPFAIFPIYVNMRSIKPSLVKAARGLGSSPWTAFRRIFFPLSLPGVFAASVLVFIFSLGFYITPALLGRGSTLMVAEYIETRILQLGQWGPGSAMGIVLLITIVVLLGILGRRFDLQKIFGAAE